MCYLISVAMMKQNLVSYLRFSNRFQSTALNFVPKFSPAKDDDIKRLNEFIFNLPKLFILTGAGISTESGIPDYRSEDVGLYARSSSRPVQYQQFIKSEDIRKRYWARNFVGWPRFSSFQPNVSHKILSRWESLGKISCIVTQNVDRLHHKAGSKNVIELHGSGYEITCLSCKNVISRHQFQETLENLNEDLQSKASEIIRPDGDVEIPQELIDRFVLPSCELCGGNLMPNIIFFGDNVPRLRVDAVKEEVSNADGLLVLGTSLSVFSSYRIILQAVEERKPIAIINIGPTRGDSHATLKVSTKCGDVLPKLKIL